MQCFRVDQAIKLQLLLRACLFHHPGLYGRHLLYPLPWPGPYVSVLTVIWKVSGFSLKNLVLRISNLERNRLNLMIQKTCLLYVLCFKFLCFLMLSVLPESIYSTVALYASIFHSFTFYIRKIVCDCWTWCLSCSKEILIWTIMTGLPQLVALRWSAPLLKHGHAITRACVCVCVRDWLAADSFATEPCPCYSPCLTPQLPLTESSCGPLGWLYLPEAGWMDGLGVLFVILVPWHLRGIQFAIVVKGFSLSALIPPSCMPL